MGNVSLDDSKQFEENFKQLKTSKSRGKSKKTKHNSKLKYITNSPNKGKIETRPNIKHENAQPNEDYLDGLDENVELTNQLEKDVYVMDYKDQSKLFNGGNTTEQNSRLKCYTCPEEDLKHDQKSQTEKFAFKAVRYGFSGIFSENSKATSNPDPAIILQNYASNGSTTISSLSNPQYTYLSPKKHQKFNSDHNIIDGNNNTICGTKIHYNGIIHMITPKHLAFRSEENSNESEYDMEKGKPKILMILSNRSDTK